MIKQFVCLELDKNRNLRFNSRTISILEQKYDMGAFKYFQSIETKGDDIRTDELVTLLWLSLYSDDKTINLDDCYDLYDIAIQKHGIEKVFTSIFTALANYFGVDLEPEMTLNEESLKKKQTKSKKK